jgi:hypothetical protein
VNHASSRTATWTTSDTSPPRDDGHQSGVSPGSHECLVGSCAVPYNDAQEECRGTRTRPTGGVFGRNASIILVVSRAHLERALENGSVAKWAEHCPEIPFTLPAEPITRDCGDASRTVQSAIIKTTQNCSKSGSNNAIDTLVAFSHTPAHQDRPIETPAEELEPILGTTRSGAHKAPTASGATLRAGRAIVACDVGVNPCGHRHW